MAVADCPGRAPTPMRDHNGEHLHRDLVLSVPEMHCAACMTKVERTLSALPGVLSVRANLGRRRVQIGGRSDPGPAIAALHAAGFRAQQLDGDILADESRDPQGRRLLTCLAVAGFAMMNVMLLSVAVWSGASDATRGMFHWISAAIALPAVAYAARPFLASAWSALGAWRLNMDVPISLAILLASGMSLYETVQGGRHTWFDAALSLTFFLLCGRYLDQLTRRAARSAATELDALEVGRVTRLGPDGAETVRPEALRPGDDIRVFAGERLVVDGTLIDGEGWLDRSLVTGEIAPARASPGASLRAGEIVVDGQLTVRVTTTGENTTLRRIAALVARAENARNRYSALADRAAAIYAPAVHMLAILAFVGWMAATGDTRLSLNIAVAVLIITCPCALGLAVPAVSTAAAGRLYRSGVLLRHDTALERLGEVDTVIFDKTGTLTVGQARIRTGTLKEAELMALGSLAAASAHPVARAVAAAIGAAGPDRAVSVTESRGRGVSGIWRGQPVRLGRGDWIGGETAATAFRLGSGPLHPIAVNEVLRPGAAETVSALRAMGLGVHMLSGDNSTAATAVANELQIGRVASEMGPDDKVDYVRNLAKEGARVLMVGDGLNDTAALAKAHASLAPATALDASRAASDVVVLSGSLEPVAESIRVARTAGRLMRQNFAIAAGYNLVAVPLALAGLATPLAAALAMSASSITVVLNAMRVQLR